MCARRRSHFLLSRQEKVTKEKATPLSASLRFAAGNLRCSRLAGSAQTRFAQTCAALFPPAAALLGAYRGDPGPGSTRLLRSLVLLRSSFQGRAKRWPVRLRPFWMRLRRGAGGVAAVPRAATAASSSDSLQLSERSAKRVASSAAHPDSVAAQVAP